MGVIREGRVESVKGFGLIFGGLSGEFRGFSVFDLFLVFDLKKLFKDVGGKVNLGKIMLEI